MTSDVLQNALEQNRQNLETLLAALEVDHEFPEDPAKQAKMAAAFDIGDTTRKDAEMTEAERVAWLFEQNAKALAAAADAAGGDTTTPDITESGKLKSVADALGGR
ncbi:hypothetical protein [Haloarcula salina]|uniref:Uncharacterized protein n=1 Tax=Haloarcula salina TaxID=1429914 RepID=A0AA41FYU8_9EURY|nr:hypothetical protein [Haloarcula salina]MBV0900168.1 hypothetical protein [Haloarcula salina]